jgi:two-component system NarL family sensor kinase
MWILTGHLRNRPSRAELESQIIRRSIALEKLSHKLLQIQDEERRKIARDLHDVVGQTLAVLKMALADMERRLRQNQDISPVLSDLHALADQGLLEIRTISHLLHPPMLDEIGFSAAAKWYVEGFAKRSGINAKVEFAPDGERLPITIEAALFRVLQEGLTNVHRYSGGSGVNIRFQREADMVALEIPDCGCGIPAEFLQRLGEGGSGAGVGLAGMRERLGELDGTLEITSSNFGTTLRAVIPLITEDRSAPFKDYYAPILFCAVPHLVEERIVERAS